MEDGDHFGEVSLIYDCPRSATVESSDYNTFARLAKPRFRQVAAEYPEWEAHLRENAIQNYRDKKIQFILRMFRRVEYLANFDDAVLFDLMFSLAPESCETGAKILDPSMKSNTLYFVEDGIVEVVTRFEGSQFVLDQLHKGSAINHRAIFLEDQMSVSIRCHKEAKLLKLSQEKLNDLIEKYKNESFCKGLMIY